MSQTILLVEDDKVLVSMYQTLLQNHGYTVTIGYNGEEGLKKALSDHPDLILLDVRMPKMDGITMLEHLRKDAWGENAKVIILSNLDPTDQILGSIVENHPTYYLIKSNNPPEQVLEQIKEVLKTKQEEKS